MSKRDDLLRRRSALSPAKRALLDKVVRGSIQVQSSHIPRRSGADPTPLSFTQQRLWFLDQLDPGGVAYNTGRVVRLKGELDVAALQRSLNAVIARHESTRTTFALVDGQPSQVIAPQLTLTIPVVDLSDLDPAEREAAAQREVAGAARQPFDLQQGPLVRALLVRIDTAEHIFLVMLHHIIADGWSLNILVQELATFYAAADESSLPALPIQYADYAIWQRESLQGQELEKFLAYWKDQLADLPILELPTDRPRPAVQTFSGATRIFSLDESLTLGLRALCQQEGVTPFMALLAAFNVLLYRYSGQDDIAVGAPIAGRQHVETENLIGFFANTLVLRSDLSGNPSFRDLLQRVRSACLGAYAHQDLPFEQLVEILQPQRDLSRNPLFQVMFVLQNTPAAAIELPGLTLELVPADTGTAKFDLWLSIDEEPRSLRGSLEYNTDLFDAATIDRMLDHFQMLLRGAIADPGQRIGHLPLITSGEQQQILVEWNNPLTGSERRHCLHELVADQARQTPEAVAVVWNEHSLTYRELDQRANQVAHYLRSLGVGTSSLDEVRVGICVERSLDMVVGLLGILKAGGAYVPLDPNYPRERVALMLEDAAVAVLLTQQDLVDQLAEPAATVICLDSDWEQIRRQPITPPDRGVHPDNLAYVIYTSGSTGRPKGVAISHASAVALVEWAKTCFTPQQLARTLAATSICFDLSVFELFVPLASGGAVVVVENALALAELRDPSPVTLINTVPSAIAELLRMGALPATPHTINLAGEPLKQHLVAQLYAHPAVKQVFNLYGPSEDTTYSTFTLTDAETVPSIGRPIDNTQAYLLDRFFNPVPIGVSGELYLGGAGLARGYLNRPDLTAERFLPDPFGGVAGGRLYRTGDLARYRADGTIDFLGRIDHQVKIRGFRIELGEIEVVLNRHAAVREAVVLAREDTSVPGEPKRLVAYVVPHAEQRVTVEELRQALGEHLPDYMIPSAFVLLEALPLTPNGKLNRQALPAPDQHRPQLESAYVAPRTPTEQMLVDLWRQVLRQPQIGVHDNFFALGGDSILTIQVIARAHQLGVELTPKQLFQKQTIAELAELLDQAPPVTEASSPHLPTRQELVDSEFPLSGLSQEQLAPILAAYASVEDIYPLTPLQQSLLFHRLYKPEPGLYFVHNRFALTTHIDHEAFGRAWQRVVDRHPPLRTSFVWQGLSQPLQVVHREVHLPLEEHDWRGLPAAEQEARAQAYITECRCQGFALDQAPHTRVGLFRMADDQYQFTWCFDYMLQDGWGFPIFLKEFFAFYQAFAQGQDLTIELPRPHRDYVAWLQHQDLAQAEAFWRSTLSGFTQPTPFVRGVSGETPRSQEGYTGHQLVFSETETQALHQMTRQYQVTLNTLLLGAWSVVVSHYSQQEDIVFGMVVSARPPTMAGVEYMVGSFNNFLPMRVQLDPDAAILPWLQTIKARQVEYSQYEYSPPLSIQQWSELPDDQPLYESYLVFENFPVDRGVQHGIEHLRMSYLDALAQTEHPLRVVAVPGVNLIITLSYYRRSFDDAAIAKLGAGLHTVLMQLAADPNRSLAALLHSVEPA